MGLNSRGRSKTRLFASLPFCRLFIFKIFFFSTLVISIRELNSSSKHLFKDSNESSSTEKPFVSWKGSGQIIYYFYSWPKNQTKQVHPRFLQSCKGLWGSSASLHRKSLLWGKFASLNPVSLSGTRQDLGADTREPHGLLRSFGLSEHKGPATAVGFIARGGAGSHVLVWKCSMLPQAPPQTSSQFSA